LAEEIWAGFPGYDSPRDVRSLRLDITSFCVNEKFVFRCKSTAGRPFDLSGESPAEGLAPV